MQAKFELHISFPLKKVLQLFLCTKASDSWLVHDSIVLFWSMDRYFISIWCIKSGLKEKKVRPQKQLKKSFAFCILVQDKGKIIYHTSTNLYRITVCSPRILNNEDIKALQQILVHMISSNTNTESWSSAARDAKSFPKSDKRASMIKCSVFSQKLVFYMVTRFFIFS